MPNAEWPDTLPQDVLLDGYDEAFPDVMLRTQMDAGPAKVRRRFTAAVVPMQVTVPLTRTQVATLATFFNDTLEGGTLPFDWVHPRTQDAATFRFTAPPKPRPQSSMAWLAVLQLEILP
ncbi:MAG: hypothetical protein AB7N54_20005 [Alphaproteobacteria bacterium]